MIGHCISDARKRSRGGGGISQVLALLWSLQIQGIFAELAFHHPIQAYFSMQGIFQDERHNFRCKGHFPARHFCRSKAYFPGFQFQPVLCCDFFLAAEDRLTIFRYDTDSPHFSHRPPPPSSPPCSVFSCLSDSYPAERRVVKPTTKKF